MFDWFKKKKTPEIKVIERNARNYTASDAHFRKAYSLNPQSKYLSGINDNSRLQQDEQRARQQMQ